MLHFWCKLMFELLLVYKFDLADRLQAIISVGLYDCSGYKHTCVFLLERRHVDRLIFPIRCIDIPLGKGESIWDRFSHIPGNMLDNATGDVTCDSYNLYKTDIQLLKDLGVRIYDC